MSGRRAREVHVAHGDSAAWSLRRERRPGRVVALRDPLSTGPLCDPDELGRWSRLRAAHYGVSVRSVRRDVAAAIRALRGAASVRLWLGAPLDEQIAIAWVAAVAPHASLHVADLAPLQPANARFPPTVGVSPPEVLRAASIAWRPLVDGELAAYRELWAALIAPAPEALDALLDRADLPSAVGRVAAGQLRRLPHHRTGLTTLDEALLGNVAAHGPRAAAVIGYTIVGLDPCDPVGDFVLWDRVLRMARGGLVEVTGGREYAGAEARLTAAGRSVLDGATAAALGEDHAGGVHLGAGRVWARGDDGRLAR